MRDATLLPASRMQARVAALRRVQRERAEKYQAMQAALKEGKNLNAMELARTLTELKAAENGLDVPALRKLEMEAVWAAMATVIYDTRAQAATDLIDNGTLERVVMQITEWKTDMLGRRYYNRDGKQALGLARFSPGVRTLGADTQGGTALQGAELTRNAD